MKITLFKVVRCVRRAPQTALQTFVDPVFNSGQAVTFLVAIIGLALLLRTAPDAERNVQVMNWVLSIQAFGLALAIWALWSLVSAPFIVISNDREKGSWTGTQFIYHRPLLVATVRCKANPSGETEEYPISFLDAEEDSFVHYSIEFERNVSNVVNASLSGVVRVSVQEPGKGIRFGDGIRATGGVRLRKGRQAGLQVRMIPTAVSITVRVYCLDFMVGNVELIDG